MPRTIDIHAAVIGYLQADGALKTLLPDGVWRGVAKSGKRFCIVDVFEGADTSVFGGRAIETVLYAIKASVLDGAGGNVSEAFARIDALMSEARLTVPGYVFMSCVREDDQPLIDYEERNTTDSTLLWRHMGGHYRVSVSVPRARRPASQEEE